MPELPSLGTVSPDDFQRIRRVFEAALSRPEAERRAFVEQACGQDTVLLAEVARMLAAEEGSQGLIDRVMPHGRTPGHRTPAPASCSSCDGILSAVHRFCPSCGTPVGALAADGRFRAGALFANRFRIVARLGRGGMGEVYRADDLELGQPVALKFLTAFRSDERARGRLRNEVRLARQLAHPNVCRVYDIGEAHGDLYLSMEYVDGEDLAALLKRIGRLPIDKGIEIARKLCAGLAAAHGKGVLHRDFKPANIMIDSHGEVRIMDFGLAAVASELDASDVRSGTPAYMAPEQLAGKEASKQSDLYALGLVLYELFTGKPPFAARDLDELQRLRAASPATTPSTLIPDISPRLESAILKCLEPEPKLRPGSALEVSASLPGGDPLAEALAAGETPSPGMVAASGPTGAVRVATGVAVLASVAIGLTAAVLMAPRAQIVGRLPLKLPPEVLTERAREIVRGLGYTGTPADWASGFRNETGWVEWVATAMGPEATRQDWDQRLGVAPYPVSFWYRQAASPLARRITLADASARARPTERALSQNGEVSVDLGLDGALLGFAAAPQGSASPGGVLERGLDWPALFNAAGLDISRFTPIEPDSNPPIASDAQLAWQGTNNDHLRTPVRVEAGAFRGRPLYFQVIFPWSDASRSSEDPSFGTQLWPIELLDLLTLFAVALVARYNWTHGRGDVRGAAIVGVYLFSAFLLSILLGAHRLSSLSQISIAVAGALVSAMTYLALEPWVRRIWPQALVTWSRVLTGRWRDPVVARDVGIGVLAAVGINCLRHGLYLGLSSVGAPAAADVLGGGVLRFTLDQLMGTRFIASAAFHSFQGGFALAMSMFFAFFLCRAVLRKPWLGAVAFLVLVNAYSLPFFMQGDWIELIGQITINVIAVVVMVRFGLLALAVWASVGWFIEHGLLTNDLTAWYGESSLVVVTVVSALALWAFHTSLGGRPLTTAVASSR